MRTPLITRCCLTLTITSALGLAACGSDDETIEGSPKPNNPGSTGGTSAGGNDDSDAGTSGGGNGGDGSAASLPYAIDDDFVASGFMGDTVAIVSKPSTSDADATCDGNPAPNANGSICHTFIYSPNSSETAWAGVFWQYPANNWTAPGLPIEPGAQKISFYARADQDLMVEFLAGMDQGPDGWKVSSVESVGTAWTAYELDLSSTTYSNVAGAFGWAIDSTAQGDNGPYTLFVDGITWQ